MHQTWIGLAPDCLTVTSASVVLHRKWTIPEKKKREQITVDRNCFKTLTTYSEKAIIYFKFIQNTKRLSEQTVHLSLSVASNLLPPPSRSIKQRDSRLNALWMHKQDLKQNFKKGEKKKETAIILSAWHLPSWNLECLMCLQFDQAIKNVNSNNFSPTCKGNS